MPHTTKKRSLRPWSSADLEMLKSWAGKQPAGRIARQLRPWRYRGQARLHREAAGVASQPGETARRERQPLAARADVVRVNWLAYADARAPSGSSLRGSRSSRCA
jgi:hypothetical protein